MKPEQNCTVFISCTKKKVSENILAMTCDFQQCGILTSVDSDEPVHTNDVQSVA